MSGRGAFSQYDGHHGEIALLDGVDERLAQSEKLRLLRDVADVDARCILDPDHGNPVSAAQRHELVDLDEALAVELASDPGIGCIFRVAFRHHALPVRNDAEEEAVDLYKARIELRTVAGPELHVLAVVHEPSHELFDVIGHLLVKGNDAVEVFDREFRFCRLCNSEELVVVIGGEIGDPLLYGVEDRFLALEYLFEEPCVVVMYLDPAGRHCLELSRCIDKLLRCLLVEIAFWRHAAYDAGAADGDVAVLMREEQCRGDSLIAAARRVRSVDCGKNGDAQFVQLCVPEEGGPAPSPVCIHLLLLGQFYAAAVHKPYEGAVKPLRDIGNTEDVVRLTCYPGACHDLIVKTYDNAPSAVDPSEAVHDTGGT